MVSKKIQIEKALGGLLKEQLSYKLTNWNLGEKLILTTQEKNRNIDEVSISHLNKIGCDINIIYVKDNKIHIQFHTTRIKQDLGDLF
jgi:hypothetical protein